MSPRPFPLAFCCLLLGVACSDPPDEPSEPDPSEVVADPATQRTIEEMFGVAPPEEEPGPDLPQLVTPVLEKGLPVGGTWREYPLLHDFTGDGRTDLVAANREEDGLSTWEAPAELDGTWAQHIEGLPRDLMYGGSDGADLDGDGDQDLVFVAHKGGLRVFLNDGHMGWTPGPEQERPFLMLDVALGDLDGDGKHDAVGIGHFEGGVGVYLGDGKGSFRLLPQSTTIVPKGRFGTKIELADIDQDGLDDLLVCTDKGARLFLTRKDEGTGELTWVDDSRGLPAPVIGNALRGLIAADFTGDGSLELAYCALADTGQPEEERIDCGVLRRDETGTWKQIDSGLRRGDAYQDMGAADFDRDGHMDLCLLTKSGGAQIYLGDGRGGFRLEGALAGSRLGSKLALGDIDGNGWVDIAVQSADSKRYPKGGGVKIHVNGPDLW